MKPTVLLTSARFGANYFLNVFKMVMPNPILTGEIFRRGGDSHILLGSILNKTPAEVAECAERDIVNLWRELTINTISSDLITKLYYYHRPDTSDVWSHIGDTAKIVHLVRENLFDAFVSRQLTLRSRLWSVKKAGDLPKGALDPIEISPIEAAEYICWRIADIDICRRRFSYGDYHEISFESISLSFRRCFETIVDMYGTEIPYNFNSAMLPQGIRIKNISNADLIKNYSDVAHLDLPYFELNDLSSARTSASAAYQ